MSVAETRDKVQRILTKNLNSVEVDEDGDFRVRYGSTACSVAVSEWGDDGSVVKLYAPILFDAVESADLYKWAATDGQMYFFGGAVVQADDKGILYVGFRHTLLGTYLDEDELMSALIGVVTTADELDDELQARFGGTRLSE